MSEVRHVRHSLPPSELAAPAHASGRVAARIDGERSRERILDAAEHLFAERGYAGSGIAAISRESGLPPSSIYWFFDSKQDLAIAVISRAADRWVESLLPRQDDGSGEPGGGAFRSFLERALDESDSRLPEFVRLQILLALELGPTKPEVLESLRQVRARGRALIANALASDLGASFDEADALAEDLSFLTMAFATGSLLFRMMEPEAIDPDQLAEEIEVATRAIAAHRVERARSAARGGKPS